MSAITAKASRIMKKYAVLTREPRCFLGSFDFSWEQRKLGELGTITTGSTPSTSIPDYYSDDGIVWVTPTDICENITFESARKLSDLGQQVGRVVPKNTILVTCIASIGKNTMLGNTGSFNQQINGLTPNENECDPYFLLTESALWSTKMKSSAAAGTMQIVNRTEFSELKTWLPSLIEQQAISDFFRQLDNLITLHQRKCANLCSPSQVVFSLLFATSTFSWEQRKLGDVGETYTGLSGKTKADFGHGQARFITYMNVFSNPISNPEMTEPIEIDPKQNEVEVGDVFFTTSSETPEEVGMSSVLLEKRGKIYLNSFCFGFRPTEKIDSYYLAYMLRSESAREKIILLAQGISRYNISKNKVMEIAVSLPSLDEQKLIGQYFRQLDNLITLHQRECISFTGRAVRLILTANKKRTTSSWEQRKLGDIGKARSGVGFPDADQGGVTGVPFFKVSDMNLDGNENEMIVANNYVTAEQIADHRWSPITELPAIFFAKVGAAVMLNRKRLCRFPFLLDNNTMAYSLSPTKWDADFAKALFGTVDLTSLVQVGALPSYNAGDVESMGIYLPSLFEQEQIGAFFKLLDNLITLHQRKPFLMKWRTSDANRNQTNRLVL